MEAECVRKDTTQRKNTRMSFQGIGNFCPVGVYLGKEARTIARTRCEEVRFGANKIPL
jgi:hypothetical protein